MQKIDMHVENIRKINKQIRQAPVYQ
jgi:hypothetical protein